MNFWRPIFPSLPSLAFLLIQNCPEFHVQWPTSHFTRNLHWLMTFGHAHLSGLFCSRPAQPSWGLFQLLSSLSSPDTLPLLAGEHHSHHQSSAGSLSTSPHSHSSSERRSSHSYGSTGHCSSPVTPAPVSCPQDCSFRCDSFLVSLASALACCFLSSARHMHCLPGVLSLEGELIRNILLIGLSDFYCWGKWVAIEIKPCLQVLREHSKASNSSV